MKKNILTIMAFAMILVLVFQSFNHIYAFKDSGGIYGIQVFYKQNSNVNDIIFVGSSNIFEDVNTGVLWEEYGMASFDLGGSLQPMWNSYYYIKEALKTQSPKLIVLDLLGVLETEDYLKESRIIRNTYGMKFSRDKIDAIKVSSPKEQWNDYIWEFPTYHSRYKELGVEDFLPNRGIANMETWKGFVINTATTPCEKPDNFQTEKTGKLSDKTETYLRKICQLCEEKRVKLLLIKTPNVSTDTDINATMKYNEAAEIGKEYGASFINFNYFYDEIGLDLNTDMGDSTHLNYRGNVKFTRYLAEYLREKYELPDRRGQEGYEEYDIMAMDCRVRTENAWVHDIYEIQDFLKEIQKENYIIIYVVSGNWKEANNYEYIKTEFEKYGINLDAADRSEVWKAENGEIVQFSEMTTEGTWYRELAPYKSLQISRIEDGYSVIFNKAEQTRVKEGINVIVYDTITETVVDTVGFSIVDGSIQTIKQR